MKRYIPKIASVLVAVLVLVNIASPALVYGDSTNNAVNDICAGVDTTNSADKCTAPETGNRVNDAINLGINIFSIIAGVISVVMLIVGGIKFLTSQGESGNTASARGTILYALVGLVIVAFAQLIAKFVLHSANQTGVTTGGFIHLN